MTIILAPPAAPQEPTVHPLAGAAGAALPCTAGAAEAAPGAGVAGAAAGAAAALQHLRMPQHTTWNSWVTPWTLMAQPCPRQVLTWPCMASTWTRTPPSRR